MKDSYLEVTFRHGRPLAAYYYLERRPGDSSHRTERAGHGILIDYSADGRPIGLELTAPAAVTVEEINEVLGRLGQPAVAAEDFAPLAAA
jgi:uncharacterized protein YuzE